MLVDKKQFHFMESHGIVQGIQDNIHDPVCDVHWLKESQVDLESDLERIISHRDTEQVYELFVRNLFQIDLKEVTYVIILTVHLKNLVNLFGRYEESLSIVESYSRLNTIINEDFLIVSLVVLSVVLRFQTKSLFEEQ